eukprot:358113-Chlamydomonas_euryale.AAC.6
MRPPPAPPPTVLSCPSLSARSTHRFSGAVMIVAGVGIGVSASAASAAASSAAPASVTSCLVSSGVRTPAPIRAGWTPGPAHAPRLGAGAL